MRRLLLGGSMVAAVLLVVALAYLDLRRDQANALGEFVDEQNLLAQTLAGTLQARLENGSSDFGGLFHAADGYQRIVAISGDRAVDLIPGAWPPFAQPPAGIVARPQAEALGLGRRLAVAALAPVNGQPWSVVVVSSARRVRDRARLGAERLVAATVLTSLLVLLFGLLVFRQNRGALALAEKLRLASALRERSEEIVQSIPLGVLALDGAGRVTSVNRFLQQRGAHTGSFAEALPIDAAERAPLDALAEEARRTRQPVSTRALKLHIANDAREVDAYVIPLGRPLQDVDCFLVLDDRTELRQLERSLGRAEKLATIGTLAAGVAHEVGTPLGVISGRAEQLLTRFPDDEQVKKSLSSILAQVERVSTTIRQLLDFARQRPVEAAAVAPATVLETARALLEHRFRQAKVSLSVDAPPLVPAVTGDSGQLEQVLVNLLINAADACAPGGHVRASAAAVENEVELSVTDDGCGIAPENLSAVLDPFFTTKKRGQGTGLGLSIAADIVKNHGGTLHIDSTVGRGTTVRVRLPRSLS